MFSKFFKSAAIALTLSASFLSSNAAAAPWTFTTTGIINNSYDASGLFGVPNASFTGSKFSLTTTVDPLAYRYINGSAAYGYNSNNGSNSGAITQTITIGGTTTTYNSSNWAYNDGQSYMHDTAGFNQAYQYVNFYDGHGKSVQSQSSVYSWTNDFLKSKEYTQRLVYTPKTGDSSYASVWMNDGSRYAYFDGTVTGLSINAVPEPAPLALFGLGLVALAFARRKST